MKSVKAIKSPVHPSAAGPAAAAGNVTLNIRPSLGRIDCIFSLLTASIRRIMRMIDVLVISLIISEFFVV